MLTAELTLLNKLRAQYRACCDDEHLKKAADKYLAPAIRELENLQVPGKLILMR